VLAAIPLSTQVLVNSDNVAEPMTLQGLLLGRCTMLLAGRYLPKEVWRRRSFREFLFRLADATWVDRDRLAADLLYPDLPQAKVTHELSRAKWHIHRVLGCQAIVYDHDTNCFGFNQRLVVLDCDTARFERQVVAARRLPANARTLNSYRETLTLYRGPFLPGEISISGWIERRRAELGRLHIEALRRAAEIATSLGQVKDAESYLNLAREQDPDDVPVYADLVRLLLQMGNHGGAREVIRDLAGRWPQDALQLAALDQRPLSERTSAAAVRGCRV
jgi:two-component SAPR family response regulator